MDQYGTPHFFTNTGATKKELSSNHVVIAGIVFQNDDNAARFMQIFNKPAAQVTVGTTAPDLVLQLAADSTDSFSMWNAHFNAFTFAITTDATGSSGGTTNKVMVVTL